MKSKKLLFVTQFEELWFDALQSLMDLRKANFNHVIFLHVIERDKVAMHRGKGYLKDEETKLREIANIRFIDWAESLFEQGMEVGAYIVVGNPLPKIISTAEEESVDLIVTGHHKRGKIEELYAGSDTVEILRRASKPVLVYKYMLPTGKINERPFERPLLAMDWSPASEQAVEYILNFKEIIKTATVINVASEKEIKGSSAMEIQATRKDQRKRLDEICDRLNDAGIEAGAHLYVGDASEQIEKAAREREATMIVAGATGKSSLKEIFMGNVAQKLAKYSSFPTLLVPASIKTAGN
ncbi:MAG: universal stress protein [Deltaproteobacteria bacterium]|nr:universal stress protein [Deltaproteobacteria bacterium]